MGSAVLAAAVALLRSQFPPKGYWSTKMKFQKAMHSDLFTLKYRYKYILNIFLSYAEYS